MSRVLLVSANVNGIRAAARRGGLSWLERARPDVLTLQEVRADEGQLRGILDGTAFADWHVAHAACGDRGRAGVAVLCRKEPLDVRTAVVEAAEHPAVVDASGRWVEADVPVGGHVVTVASAYVPTGQAGTPRQDEKMRFLASVGDRLGSWAADGRYAVLTGDLNVAHRVEDLRNWKGNLGKAGFLPAEQAELDRWLDGHGFVDVHRRLHGPGPGPYTWWSWRGRAFDADAGWRIDYQLASAPLAARAVRAEVGRAASYEERWSDHAPVCVLYDL